MRFLQPVFAAAIEVHESLNPGAISRISVRNLNDNTLHDVWTGTDPNDTCSAILRIDVEPLPFNSGTVIRFALPQAEEVELAVYNLAGQKVVTLVQGLRQAGSYAIHWDATNAAGQTLATGIYLYKLRAGERQETRKLTMLR